MTPIQYCSFLGVSSDITDKTEKQTKMTKLKWAKQEKYFEMTQRRRQVRQLKLAGLRCSAEMLMDSQSNLDIVKPTNRWKA